MTRVGLVALLLAAAACSSSASTPTTVPTVVPSTAVASFDRVIGSRHVSNVVATPNGYEAASWAYGKTLLLGRRPYRYREALYGHIYFWRSRAAAGPWTKVGSSTYPAYASGPDPCRPTIKAGLVSGGRDAVFIVDACITGDGVLNAVAFANGSDGWGLVETLANGDLASLGHRTVLAGSFIRPASAARYGLDFKDNELETVDGTRYFADAGNDLFPRVSLWRWSSRELVRTSDSAFISKPALPPMFGAQPLPAGSCPADGTYAAALALHGFPLDEHQPASNSPVTLEVFPPGRRFPQVVRCKQTLPAATAMTVLLVHSTRPFSTHVAVSDRRWMSAPIWMLCIEDLGFTIGHGIPLFVGKSGDQLSPYVVNSRYGVNELVMEPGDLIPGKNFAHNVGRPPRPATGTVTFYDGKIVGLAVHP